MSSFLSAPIFLFLLLATMTKMTVDGRPSSDHVVLLFVRHGESAANADPNIRFDPDYAEDYVRLSPKGRSQAIELGQRLQKEGVRHWSSPMFRALETTDLIMRDAPTQSFTVDKRLKELHWPDFTNEDERQQHKAAMKTEGMFSYRNNEIGFFESGQDVVNRLSEFLLEHRAALRAQPNVIVCHEIVMRAFSYLISANPHDFETLKFDNCETLKWEGNLMELYLLG